MISSKELNLAGWLSVISAVLIIPACIISFMSGMANNSSVKLADSLINAISTGLFVYIYLSLKRLLNSKSSFYDVNSYIWVLIVVNLAFYLISILHSGENPTDRIAVVSLITIIPLGIVFIVFSIKLLNCPDDLYGLLKPFSYVSIATGFFIATVIFFMFGIITSAIADIILGIMFFRAAKDAS